MTQLEHLFSPIRIGSMELPNRIVMAPMTVDYGNDDETPSDRQIAYYSERAAGGMGLIGLEVCSVDSDHRYQQHSLGLHSDSQIEGHRRLVDAIHAHGVKVQPQISHPGPESLAPFFKQIQPMGPSVIRTETTRQTCRELALEEIDGIVELYAEGARRAREAGYDGIELHAAHSYMMLGSFLSPLRNFRTDDYAGGRFEGRSKLLIDVVRRIRSRVGNDFPITVRLSGFERESGGREVGDTQRLAPLLVEAGVDCFHVSGGVGDANITQIITGPEFAPGYNYAAAEAIKHVVDVPVMAVGQNMDPEFMERAIAEQRVDLVAVGRALLADPHLPKKAREGRLREINRCNLCQGCVDAMTTEFNGAACSVNPRVGREADFPLVRAAKAKQLLVIGGGPGGLAAAMYAAERGHEVTLMEKDEALGGRFRLASTVFPGNQLFLDYLVRRVEDLPVDVRLGTHADASQIQALSPDAIVVAAGGCFFTPEVPGEPGGHRIQDQALLELLEQARKGAAADELGLGERVAILGANLIGLELAEYLAQGGKRVHVVEPSRRLATPAGKKRRCDHGKHLDELGVPINVGVGVERVSEQGVHLQRAGGPSRLVEADTVIVVGHPEANPAFTESLQGLAPELHTIGDATGFGLSKKAVTEAMQVVWQL